MFVVSLHRPFGALIFVKGMLIVRRSRFARAISAGFRRPGGAPRRPRRPARRAHFGRGLSLACHLRPASPPARAARDLVGHVLRRLAAPGVACDRDYFWDGGARCDRRAAGGRRAPAALRDGRSGRLRLLLVLELAQLDRRVRSSGEVVEAAASPATAGDLPLARRPLRQRVSHQPRRPRTSRRVAGRRARRPAQERGLTEPTGRRSAWDARTALRASHPATRALPAYCCATRVDSTSPLQGERGVKLLRH